MVSGDKVLISLIFLVILISLSCIAFADITPTVGGGGDAISDEGMKSVAQGMSIGNGPQTSVSAVKHGFWVAYCYDKTGIADYVPCGSWLDKRDISKANIDLASIYAPVANGGFGVGDDLEIAALALYLHPWPFLNETPEGERVMSSHGIPDGGVAYTGDSAADIEALLNAIKLDCEPDCNLDNLNECYQNLASTDNACSYIPILEGEDCEEIADLDRRFCEGVPFVGANAELDYNPLAQGYPGFGGCDFLREFGRDSLNGTASRPTLNYNYWSEAGICCGNEDIDLGALASDTSGTPAISNFYICQQWGRTEDESSDKNFLPVDKDGYFLWLSAEEQAFVIQQFEKDGAKYDALSNSKNWFVCGGEGNTYQTLLDYYKPYNPDADLSDEQKGLVVEGALLKEFSFLPEPAETLKAGTTEGLGESEDQQGSEGPRKDDAADEGSGDSYLEDFDDFEKNIGTVTGVTSECDLDGDGKDADPAFIAGKRIDDPDAYEMCTSPSTPFDCDDDDDTRYPGNIDYCEPAGVDEFDAACDGDACIQKPTSGEEEGVGNIPGFPPEILLQKFICNSEQDRTKFTECCGYSLNDCLNDIDSNKRRTGSAVYTLREFNKHLAASNKQNCGDSDNCVLVFATKEATQEDRDANAIYRLPLYAVFHDAKITNYSNYETLEFYIYFSTSFEVELWMGSLRSPDRRKDYYQSYKFPKKLRIVDYAVNQPALNKWLHIVIPVKKIYSGDEFPIDVLVFASRANRLPLKTVEYEATGAAGPIKYSNVIGVDKIFLRPKKEKLDNAGYEDIEQDNFYCSGTWPAEWFTDLDNNSLVTYEQLSAKLGEAACSDIPSYAWTGEMCCGDDTNKSFKEFFNDTQGGCWAGNPRLDNERVMKILFNITTSKGEKEVETTCTTERCSLNIDAPQSTFIENPYNKVYKIMLQGWNKPDVDGGKLTSINNEEIFIETPLQAIFYDGNFYGCNAADFMLNVENTETPDTDDVLITNENNFFPDDESCPVLGDAFCDHDGGWSTAFAVDASGDIVNANRRNTTKTTFNLIKNGGFEG